MGLLYTNMKVFHYHDKIDSLSEDYRDILPPIHIRLKPTNVCNHNCRYCAYRADNLQLGRDMVLHDHIPEKKMMEILADMVEIGVKAVTFSGGGEPFCYPHLLKAVKRLVDSEIRFASLTNGAGLTGEIAELFAHYATWIRISMDGWDDESYVRYRKVGMGEFTKIMGNIEALKKMGGKCYVGVSLIVDADNASHVYDAVKNIKNAGADSIKISPCIVSNAGAENDRYHKEFFNSVREQVQSAISNLAGKDFEIFDAYHKLDEKFLKDYDWCPMLQILCVIGADQNVYSCQDKAYNLEEGMIGSIKDIRLKDFWFNGKSKFFKINPSKVCSHHCVANAKNRSILEYLKTDKEHMVFV